METTERHPGYRAPDVVKLAGITYRQLDYLVRGGAFTPSLAAASGSGSHRLFSRADVAALILWRTLVAAGLSPQRASEAQLLRADLDPLPVGEPVTVVANRARVGTHLQRGVAAMVVWPDWSGLA